MPAANSGPLPPNAKRAYSRGSRPRSLETARMARIMFEAAIRWGPWAASTSGIPRGRATFSSNTSCPAGARPPPLEPVAPRGAFGLHLPARETRRVEIAQALVGVGDRRLVATEV